MFENTSWPHLIAFAVLLYTAVSAKVTLYIARRFFGDEQTVPRGRAWETATTRTVDFGRATLPDADAQFLQQACGVLDQVKDDFAARMRAPLVDADNEPTRPMASVPPPVPVVARKVGV